MTTRRIDQREILAWLIDMDGVLWRGDRPMPGLEIFFESLRKRNWPFMLVTNNARTSPALVQQKLDSFGIQISQAEVLTSAMAASAYLRQIHPGIERVFVVGEASLRQTLEQGGFEVLADAQDAQVVVVGLDFGITYASLAEAAYAVGNGALLLGTNPDTAIPTERGLAPGNGALLAAIQATTGIKPIIVGKPEPFLYQEAMNRLGVQPQRTLALGDRLETDILGGRKANMKTALVLTGVTNRSDLASQDIVPDWVFADLPALLECLA
jgi:4-nitrophenyl phosphatase